MIILNKFKYEQFKSESIPSDANLTNSLNLSVIKQS